MTLNEISYRILNIVKPKLVDDDSIDISEVKYDVRKTIATLMKQKFNKKYLEIPSNATQTIKNLEVEVVNSSTMLDPEIAATRVVLRTKLKVPKFIHNSSGKPVIKEVSPSNILGKNFTVINSRFAKSAGSGRFNRKNVFAFYENEYLYFITRRLIYKTLQYVDIQAVFEDPKKVFDFLNENYGTSYDDNSEYPVPNDMIKQVEDMVLYNKLLTQDNASIDVKNDGADQITEQQ